MVDRDLTCDEPSSKKKKPQCETPFAPPPLSLLHNRTYKSSNQKAQHNSQKTHTQTHKERKNVLG